MPEFARPLSEHEVAADPLDQFAAWFREATEAGIHSPEAAAVASADAAGAPSVRMVLVKQADHRGFVFFTNYSSRKARELAGNPRGALLFHWDALGRQVRVEGDVQRVTTQETAQYVRSRPRGSQLSALGSPQSQPVQSREALEHEVSRLDERYAGAELPLPENWGGFRLVPRTIEFWQHRQDRLHDRLLFTLGSGGVWRMQRLAP
ncbi:MAG: pyridoxamine 5'-phosphate oxidase [Solirubrobacteraceae bacterium]